MLPDLSLIEWLVLLLALPLVFRLLVLVAVYSVVGLFWVHDVRAARKRTRGTPRRQE